MSIRNNTSSFDGNILILGSGSQAKVIYDMLLDMNCHHDLEGFVDAIPNSPKPSATLFGHTVKDAGKIRSILKDLPSGTGILLATGDNEKRKELFELSCDRDLNLLTIIHPAATISSDVDIFEGCTIHANAFIGINAKLNNGVIVNTGATVDHDTEIGAFSQIAPGTNIAGNVTIGKQTMIGVGCSIAPNTSIGKNSYIEAGSVVWGEHPPDSHIKTPQKN